MNNPHAGGERIPSGVQDSQFTTRLALSWMLQIFDTGMVKDTRGSI